MIPGKPKYAPVCIGHEGTHSGVSVHQGALLDDYPVRFAMRAHEKPASSKLPPAGTRPKRRYYGEKE